MLHDCRHPHVVLMIGACLDLEHTVLPTFFARAVPFALRAHMPHLHSACSAKQHAICLILRVHPWGPCLQVHQQSLLLLDGCFLAQHVPSCSLVGGPVAVSLFQHALGICAIVLKS